jgi:serine/threonine protein kinase
MVSGGFRIGVSLVSQAQDPRTRHPTAFGKYQVLARLGHGGMGTVYLAVHVGPAGTSKLLVIKQLRTDMAALDEARSMFLDEARLSMRLNHPNIVQTIEVVDDVDALYLVMEFLDGQPVARIFDPKHADAFPLRTKIHVLTDALEGLHYAHELADYDGTPLQVVHRDVSPHNIFVTYDGHVKLVDFGIAKAAGATTVTESGVFKGKIRYAAPEQALCAEVDRRADVFAMGTILWEILAGRRMWEGRPDAAIMASLVTGNVPDLRNVRPDVPPELEEICRTALQQEPNARFQTALEFRDALLEYEHSLPSERTLGGAVLSAFAADRRALHAVIDAQAKAMREAIENRHTMREIPLIAPASSGPLPVDDASMSKALSKEVPTAVLAAKVGTVRRPTRWIVGAVVASTAVIVALAISLRPRRDEALSASASASATAVAAPVASVHLSFRASPANARFVLDGAMLSGNPYEADVARDDAPHRLSVEADGFDPRILEPHFTRDVHMDVTLGPSPAAAGAPAASALAASPAGSARPAQPPRASGAPPKQGPQRRIDEEDPYKQ